MTLWHPDDWDGEITAEARDQVLTMRERGQLDPAVAMISPAFEGGRALLADLGHLGIESGSLAPLLVVSGRRLSELLDRHLGAGVGGIVMSVRLPGPDLVRAVLVLCETIEVHALRPEPAAENPWSLCIVDLAAKRLHLSDDGGATWRSSNLTLFP
jgi:hypothetical protein